VQTISGTGLAKIYQNCDWPGPLDTWEYIQLEIPIALQLSSVVCQIPVVLISELEQQTFLN
jgi:hypothetical protein